MITTEAGSTHYNKPLDLVLNRITNLEQVVENTTRELDRLRALNKQLGQENEDLKRENEELGEFIGTIAHEVNNPLHVASGFISFLEQEQAGPLNETYRQHLKAAQAGVNQARALIQDLLCESQLGKLQLDVNLKLVDLRKVVRQTFQQMSLLAPASEVELRGFYLNGAPCMVLGAENRLQQVMNNLLLNAVKFSPKGGVVRVTIMRDEGTYLVLVTDEGPGISPKDQELIFQRRYQVKDSSGKHRAGYGLGLSIARDLVELQGGSIGVSSDPGRGSCFWFRLPLLSHHN